MSSLNQHFGFSSGQLRFLAVCTVLSLILVGALIIRSFSTATDQAISLPVITDNPSPISTGIFTLDPNTAPADSLELLPGIGRELADRIVLYRQDHRFDSEIDVTNVKGIGPRTYERLRPYLRIHHP